MAKAGCYPNNGGVGGLGASILANNYNYEIQRTNHFEVSITDIPGNDTEFSQEFRIAVSSITFPSLEVESSDVRVGNQQVKIAGMPSVGDCSVTLKDFIGIDLERRMHDWFRVVYDPETGMMGMAKDYKTKMTLYMYAPDGQQVRSWACYGVWISNVEFGDLSYDGSDKRQLTCSMHVDNMFMNRDERDRVPREP